MAESGGKSTTTKWFDVTVLEEKSTLPARRLLLEEEKRWKDYTGRSYETEGSFTLKTKRDIKCLYSNTVKKWARHGYEVTI